VDYEETPQCSMLVCVCVCVCACAIVCVCVRLCVCLSYCVAIQKKGCMLIRKLSDENLAMQDVTLDSLANIVIDAMLHRQSDLDVQVEVIPYVCVVWQVS